MNMASFYFQDRAEVGERLAHAAAGLSLRRPVVLGIPRGGVVVAARLAQQLDCPLDMVLVSKIAMPGDPESAMGAVDEDGDVVWNLPAQQLGVSASYSRRAVQEGRRLLRQRRQILAPQHVPLDLTGRDVLVVDDGLATGATMFAALRLLRKKSPARLIAAAGVASLSAERALSSVADDVLMLWVPPSFRSVSEFFLDFNEVSDDEVAGLLREAWQLDGGHADVNGPESSGIES